MKLAGIAGKAIGCLLLVADSAAFAAANCGDLENAYGPYDYTDPAVREQFLPVVERAHFTPSVENLVRGHYGTIIGDLDYTLRAFPNHHRALYSMMKHQLAHPVGLDSQYYTIECYFQRAIRFAPHDPVPHMLFGIFHYKSGRLDGALEKYLDAYRMSPDWVELNYNLGLLYLELDKDEKAVLHAKYAYEHGYVLQGLKDKLSDQGLWPEEP